MRYNSGCCCIDPQLFNVFEYLRSFSLYLVETLTFFNLRFLDQIQTVKNGVEKLHQIIHYLFYSQNDEAGKRYTMLFFLFLFTHAPILSVIDCDLICLKTPEKKVTYTHVCV